MLIDDVCSDVPNAVASIAKKFAILLFSIPQCRWFWGLKFQIFLRFGISIL